MSDLVRLSMSIERGLYDALQKLVRKNRYTNRSEFIRDLIRQRLVEEQWQGGGQSLATVTIIYDHHTHGLTQKLIALQHRYTREIFVNLHLHVSEHRCAEVVVLGGRSTNLRTFVESVRRLKGVLHTAVSVSAAGSVLT